MTQPGTIHIDREVVEEVLTAVQEVCTRHGITALDEFQESCRLFAEEKTLNIAILGRFKAGKSSFLNHLLGRPLLPVGVIPVTSVVTEIQWGPRERSLVEFTDERTEEFPLERISEFIAEERNPQNVKGVTRVRVELPSMERYRGIRFVDTPGLESVFEHNTDVSREWLPNVGLALVAVGVDPPLSQHDIALIRDLSRYTPNISLLLTKVDSLEEKDRAQVLEFVRRQLGRYWKDAVPVFPYSIRPGFESLRAELDASLLSEVRAGADEQRGLILAHKLESLLSECAGYLGVALKSAEVADTEKEQLRSRILGQKESLDDTRLALRLIIRHAAGGSRSTFESLLRKDQKGVERRLHTALDEEMPAWMRSLSAATEGFDQWMRDQLVLRMSELSARHRGEFVEPVRRVSRQLSQSLQDFRNRLSERVLETLGVPLRTTEMELRVADPKSPDVRVGKIFDRSWELLSWIIPMPLIKGLLRSHFHRKVDQLVFTNLSRLASQWEEIVNGALFSMEKESGRRLDGLIVTIEKLLASVGQEAPQIREDLERLEQLRHRVSQFSA